MYTSSNTRRAPLSSQAIRKDSKNSLVALYIPPSPWIGSTKTPAILPWRIKSTAAWAFPYSRKVTPGMTGSKGVLYCSLLVKASEPKVLP